MLRLCKFDARNQRYQCTDRNQGVTTTGYDANSNVKFVLDADNVATNKTTSYVYDVRNLKVETACPDHNSSSSPGEEGFGVVK